MVNCLFGLRHYGVIRSNDDNGNVCHLRAPCTHCGKGLVARGVQEGDMSAIGKGDIICSNVLGNSSGLSGNYIGLADVVQQGGLSVVYVSHYGYNWRSWKKVLRLVCLIFLIYGLLQLCCYKVYLIAKLLCNKHKGLCIQPLVYGDHKAKAHAGANDFGYRNLHHYGKVIYGNKLRYLKNLALLCLMLNLLHHLLTLELSLLLSVFGAFGLALALYHTLVGLLNLLLNFVLVNLCPYWLEVLLLAVLAVVGVALIVDVVLCSLLIVLIPLGVVVLGDLLVQVYLLLAFVNTLALILITLKVIGLALFALKLREVYGILNDWAGKFLNFGGNMLNYRLLLCCRSLLLFSIGSFWSRLGQIYLSYNNRASLLRRCRLCRLFGSLLGLSLHSSLHLSKKFLSLELLCPCSLLGLFALLLFFELQLFGSLSLQ